MTVIHTSCAHSAWVGATCGLLCATLFVHSAAFGQTPNSSLPRNEWTAQWISHPTASLREPGVFHFRKAIRLSKQPARFVVHVSADNRFQLFANGKRVGERPARADLSHWRYETFDLAPFLREGDNIIASTVWQFGIYAPLAQVSDRLAFLLEGETADEVPLNTGATWQVEQEISHMPQLERASSLRFCDDHCWHPAWIAGLRYCANRTESRKVAMGRSLDATSQGNDCGPLRQEYEHHRGIHNSAGFSVRNACLERPLLPTSSGRAEIPVAVANSHGTLQLCRTTSAL